MSTVGAQCPTALCVRQSTVTAVRKANLASGVSQGRETCLRVFAVRTFCLLLCSLFVLISSSGTYPEYRPHYSMRRSLKCLFCQHFRLRLRSKAEPPLWPNCAFYCLAIQDGPKPLMPSFLSVLLHLIATCRMAGSPAAHSMRSSRQRKRRSQPLSVLSSRCWHDLFPLPHPVRACARLSGGGRKKSWS